MRYRENSEGRRVTPAIVMCLLVVCQLPVLYGGVVAETLIFLSLNEGKGDLLSGVGASSYTLSALGATWTKGPWGHNALSLDGKNSRLDLPALRVDLSREGLTVEMWLRLEATASGQLFMLGGPGANCQTVVEKEGVVLRAGPKELRASSRDLFNGRWHLMDCALSPAGGMTLFVDGLLVAEMPEGPSASLLKEPRITLGGGFSGDLGPTSILRGCLSGPQVLARYASNAAVAHRAETPPVIDGKLSDPCWQTGAKLTNFSVAGQVSSLAPPEEQTEVLVAYDSDNLYVAGTLRCQNTADLIAGVTQRDDDNLFNDDVLELFLDPEQKRSGGYHIGVNARGAIWDGGPQGTAWNDTTAAVSVGEKSWFIEMAIPIRSLGATTTDRGDAWVMNVAREQKRPVRNTSWSPLGTPSFLTWDQFGELRFGGSAQVRVSFPNQLTPGSTSPFPVVLRGGTGNNWNWVIVQMEKFPMTSGNEVTEQRFSVPSGGTVEVTVALDQTLTGKAPDSASVQSRKIVRVLDADSGGLLAQVVAIEGGFDAGALIRDTPTYIRKRYLEEHPELCTTDKRLIYNGTLYVSPDHVTPRAVTFFHSDRTQPTLDGPSHGLRLVFKMPVGVEVTAVAASGELTPGPEKLPEVREISLNGRPAKSYTFNLTYMQNQPENAGSHIAYFKTNLSAGRVTQGAYYLKWKGGRQKSQSLRIESIAIPRVVAPRRFFIMPWGLEQGHLDLLAPNFPEDYTSLGMNTISFYYLGHWKDKERLQKALRISEDLAAKAKRGGVFLCYNEFFPWSPNAEYGMLSWMNDPEVWAYGADGKPIPGWLNGHTPCPSYRGKFYQEAVSTLENSEQLRRVPANLFSCDFEYYGGNGTQICFCPRCVSLFEKWFREKHPEAEYIDPFTLDKNTERPKTEGGAYEVKTKYPLQYKAWVEFKIEQFADMAGGFKSAIAKAIGTAKTSPFDRLTFADWAAVYPTLLQQEQCLYGPYSMDHAFDLYAVGAYGPPALAFQPNFEEYVTLYYEKFGKRRCMYDTPSTSGAWIASNYACMPEHARYYLMESAMNGVQGFIMFHYTGLEGKQLQVNAEVFGAFALVDDLITQGRRMKDLKIEGKEMHARGLRLGDERLVLAGDHYVATDKRSGVLTCPVETRLPVYDVLKRRKLGYLTPKNNKIALTLEGLNDRARFLYIGNRWEKRLKMQF